MVPPLGVSAEYDNATPPDRDEDTDRDRDGARRREAAAHQLRRRDGDDHECADQQQPDDAHREHDGGCGEDGDEDVHRRHGHSGGAGVLLVVGRGEQLAGERERQRDDGRTQRSEDDEVALSRRGDRTEEVGIEVRRSAALGLAHEHDAPGDPAVEEDRERDVAAGAAARADELDRHRPDQGGDQRRGDRRPAGEQPHGDTGQRDVAQPVADQCETALDDVEPDHRRGQPDEQRSRGARAA
jgi:hypothetical protein